MNQFCNMLAVFHGRIWREKNSILLSSVFLYIILFLTQQARGFYPLVQREGFLVATGGPWGGGGAIVSRL